MKANGTAISSLESKFFKNSTTIRAYDDFYINLYLQYCACNFFVFLKRLLNFSQIENHRWK